MSGLYIHIPFCASRCIYCDFYSTTLRDKAHEYVDALLKEYDERRDFLPSEKSLKTIYIGGGTPSQLPTKELIRLIINLLKKINYDNIEEFTIEANPEDVTKEWSEELKELKKLFREDILRISLGVQSLNDNELKIIKRRHNSAKPQEAVRLLREAGINNISLDLMYGLPSQTIDSWEKSIDGIIALKPEHISAYCLSIEEGTLLQKLIKEGKLRPAEEELCLEMAELLRKKLKDAGYIQYEISNYSKKGFESKHNSNYWNGMPYLGLGPGAHSYDGERRRMWNVGNLDNYLNGIREEDGETLNEDDLFNEKVMLGLRTKNGVGLNIFDKDPKYLNIIKDLEERALVQKKSNNLILTESGLALADDIIRTLMR